MASFSGMRVAAQVEDLQPVVQRPRDGVHVVRRRDEEDPAEVVFSLEVVIAEGAVVRGIEYLHEGSRGIPAPVAVELVELVQENHRVVDAGLGEAVDDAPGHGADIRAAMPADLGLVPDASERDANEGAPERGGDAFRDAALAGARRARETEDGGRLVGGLGRRASGRPAHVRPHPADGEVLEDAVLDVPQPVVRALEVLRDAGDVHLRRREPAPRELEDGVEEAADEADLGAHRRRLPELGELAGDELARRRREVRLRGAPHVAGDVLVARLAGLLDLVAQHAQFLVQQQAGAAGPRCAAAP